MAKTSNTVKLNEQGLIEGADVDQVQAFAYFPTKDLYGFFELAMVQFAARAVTERNSVLPEKRFANSVMAVPVPLPQEIVDEISKIEDDMLNNPNAKDACARCEATCHGVHKKGDLLRLMVTGALIYGFRLLTDMVMANLVIPSSEDAPQPRRISAEEYFNSTKKEIVH